MSSASLDPLTRPPGGPPPTGYYEQPPAAPPAASPRHREVEIPPAPLPLVALYDLIRKTRGTLSLDLSRRKFKGGNPGDSLWRVAPESAAAGPRRRGRPPSRPQPGYGAPPPAYGAPPPAYGAPPPPAYGAPPGAYRSGPAGGYQPQQGGGYAPPAGAYYEAPNVSFMNTGARLKVMRHIEFGPRVEVEKGSGLRKTIPTFDIGAGLAFELDTAELVRLKVREILSLRALPYPALKIQKRLRWPNSSWGVRLSYECPLESITTFYRPPARLMLSIDNMHSNGVQLTQAGLEFNYAQLFGESKQAQLRASGLLSLPRELPIVEGQPLAGLEIKRLGVKTEWW